MTVQRVFLALLFLTVCLGLAHAQSVTLAESRNSLMSQVSGSISNTFHSVSVQSGYSIAGVLDVGFALRSQGFMGSERLGDIGMLYSLTLAKQSHAIPLSIQLFGSYVYRYATSQFLRDNRLSKDGSGYSLALLIARDFLLLDWITLRFGAATGFRNIVTTTSVNFVYDPAGSYPIDYSVYPEIDRTEELSIGPYVGVVFRVTPHTLIGFALSVEFVDTGDVRYTPELQLAFLQ